MRTTQVTTTVYIANDGKTFNSEMECLQYENTILENLKYVMYNIYFLSGY